MKVDCLVVGGGVAGCAAALHLARRGREVVLLERDEVASGASGGLGMRGVRANGRDARELPLMRRAYDIWPALGYERIGHLHLSERSEDIPGLSALAEQQAAAGVPSDVVTGSRLRELEPELSDTVVAGVLCPLDGVADHTATTKGLAEAARRSGVEVEEGTGAAGLRRDGDRLLAITADEEVIEARATLLLANTGTARLLADVGAQLPVFDVFPQVLVTERLDRVPVGHLIGHAHRPLALKALPGGEVMVTGGRLGRAGSVDPDQVRENLVDAAAVYPSLAAARLRVATADRAESVSHDFVPIVDRVPGAADAWFAAGWSGHGWAIAPVVAELLAEWVDTGARPEMLEPLALARFSTC